MPWPITDAKSFTPWSTRTPYTPYTIRAKSSLNIEPNRTLLSPLPPQSLPASRKATRGIFVGILRLHLPTPPYLLFPLILSIFCASHHITSYQGKLPYPKLVPAGFPATIPISAAASLPLPSASATQRSSIFRPSIQSHTTPPSNSGAACGNSRITTTLTC